MHQFVARMSTPRRLLTIAPRLWRCEAISARLGIRFTHSATPAVHPAHPKRHRIDVFRYRMGPKFGKPRFNSGDEILEASERTKIYPKEPRALLQTSYHKIKLLPFEEQASAAADVGASKIVRYLQNLDLDTRNEVVTSQLADFLCWHLEAEYSQQIPRTDSAAPEFSSPVTEWLDEACSRSWQSWSSSTDYWATRVLASHVKAIMYWHMDFTSAVRIVERYNDHMHTGRAIGYLHDALTTSSLVTDPHNRSLKISEESFNRYLKIANSEGRHAVAMLHHPTAPDALPLYRLHQAAPPTIPGKLGNYHARPEQYARASELLREQGMEDEANDMYQAWDGINGGSA
ncbi:unnamed protein product [Cercospora beticola]|nr:unnamed protein product [Cercospora beticola]